jgi:hypothetical protein
MQERRAAGGETSMVFSWEQYPAGVYWLVFHKDTGQSIAQKVIIQY